MTTAQRKLLEKFAARDRPLCKAIAAALAEVERLETEVRTLRACKGDYRALVKSLRKAREKGVTT